MATKTANVTARIQPNIKEQAEAILVVYLADGTKVVYDDMTKRAKMLAA